MSGNPRLLILALPVAIGVILDAPAPTYDAELRAQESEEAARARTTDLNQLLRQAPTWELTG